MIPGAAKIEGLCYKCRKRGHRARDCLTPDTETAPRRECKKEPEEDPEHGSSVNDNRGGGKWGKNWQNGTGRGRGAGGSWRNGHHPYNRSNGKGKGKGKGAQAKVVVNIGDHRWDRWW